MNMQLYQLYALVSILLIIAEVFAPGFVLMPIGVAGLVTALVAYFQPQLWLHAVFFICSSGLVLLAIARLRDHTKESQTQTKQSDGVIGQIGTVLTLKTAETPLQVKIFGDVWEVLDSDTHSLIVQKLSVGDRVKVTAIQGNKISIEPM
jgi:membrane protein implicated in regulation of membrane protease activity